MLYGLALLLTLVLSCSFFEENSDDEPAAKPTKSTATGKTGDVADDGLSCKNSGDFRMTWGFPATAAEGTLDLALFDLENYHFTATWYAGEDTTRPDDDATGGTAKIVGHDDSDAVLTFVDLSAVNATSDSKADDGTTLDGGYGGDTLKEVTVIINGKVDKMLLCDKADGVAPLEGGIQAKSTSINDANPPTATGQAKLLKVVMNPLCWGDREEGIDTTTNSYGQMFKGCDELKEVSGKIDTGMTSFTNLFKGLTKLETVDASAWDTSAVTEMNGMFEGATSLTELIIYDDKGTTADETDDVQWDTSNVTNMQNMFKSIGSTTTPPNTPLTIVGLDKLDYGAIATAGTPPSQGMEDMFSGSKLALQSFKDLLFGLLTKSPASGDPHLNAGTSTCGDGTNKATNDHLEACCIRAQHKLYKDSSWSNLISGDITNASPPAPYNQPAFPNSGYGTCTLPP